MAGVECAFGPPFSPRDSFMGFPDSGVVLDSFTGLFDVSLTPDHLFPGFDIASSNSAPTINPEAHPDLGRPFPYPVDASPRCDHNELSILNVSDIKKSTRPAKPIEACSGITKLQTRRKSKQSCPTNNKRTKTPAEKERRGIHLQKNRDAASRCRAKKKDWTDKISGCCRDLAAENKILRAEVDILTDMVYELKTAVLQHTDCGYDPIDFYLQSAVKKVQDNIRARCSAGNPPPPSLPECGGSITISDVSFSSEEAGFNIESASLSIGSYDV